MITQKRLMAINPVVAWAYGVWFILQPDGYLRYVGQRPDEATPTIMSIFVAFGGILLVLGYALWVIRELCTAENTPKVMSAFSAMWLIAGSGILYGLFAYAPDSLPYPMTLLEAGAFLLLSGIFWVWRSPNDASLHQPSDTSA